MCCCKQPVPQLIYPPGFTALCDSEARPQLGTALRYRNNWSGIGGNSCP
jgi:hypothetical protein